MKFHPVKISHTQSPIFSRFSIHFFHSSRPKLSAHGFHCSFLHALNLSLAHKYHVKQSKNMYVKLISFNPIKIRPLIKEHPLIGYSYNDGNCNLKK